MRSRIWGVRLVTDVDVERVKDMFFRFGITCDIAATPSKYLCNAAFWHMLRKNNGNTVFIHIHYFTTYADNNIAAEPSVSGLS